MLPIRYHHGMPAEGTPPANNPGMAERDSWLTVPNALTAARLLAIIPFTLFAMQGRDRAALIVFALGGVTDALDGAIARRFGQSSRIGRVLDPLTDKLFTGISFVVLALGRTGLPRIPLWLMFAVLFRDVLIVAGSYLIYRTRHETGFRPSVFGKVNTFLEIGFVVLFFARQDFPLIAEALPILYLVLLVSLLVSTADYVRTGILMARARSAA